MSEETDDPLEALVAIIAVATLPLTALAGIFLGEAAAATVAIVGWLFLVPVIAIVSDYVDIQAWLDDHNSGEAVPTRATMPKTTPSSGSASATPRARSTTWSSNAGSNAWSRPRTWKCPMA